MSDATTQLSVCIDDLRMEIKRALRTASDMGFRTVDIGSGIDPRQMGRSAQRHLMRYLSDLGLRLGSFRGPSTGPSYADGAAGERRLERMRSIVALAGDLRVPVVSTSLGGGNLTVGESARLLEALATLADDSDRFGVRIAIETTGIAPGDLRSLLSELNCPTLGACCDSGAMLIEGHDPHRIGDDLAGRIHLVRLRDATAGFSSSSGRETSMGEGALDIPAFIGALFEAGFKGDMVVTRSECTMPAHELVDAGKKVSAFMLPM